MKHGLFENIGLKMGTTHADESPPLSLSVFHCIREYSKGGRAAAAEVSREAHFSSKADCQDSPSCGYLSLGPNASKRRYSCFCMPRRVPVCFRCSLAQVWEAFYSFIFSGVSPDDPFLYSYFVIVFLFEPVLETVKDEGFNLQVADVCLHLPPTPVSTR